MKKIVLVAAAAGLMTLAACTPKTADNTTGNDTMMDNTMDTMGNVGDTMMGGNDMMSNDTMGNDAMMDNTAM